MRQRAATRLSLVLAVMVAAASALEAAETARQILDRRKALDDGEQRWNDRHQHMKMHIVGSGGARERELDVYEKRLPNDEQKAIVFLRGPAEVKGTAFLAFNHKGKAADQWLYLPGLKRVRQITASARNERFVGSDLTYHDLDLLTEMISWSDDDASATLRPEEAIDGTACYTIELSPQREEIGYKQIILWLAQQDLVPRQIHLYEEAARGGWLGGLVGTTAETQQPSKRIRQRDVRSVGKIPVAHAIEVETVGKGTRTQVEIVAVEFNRNLDDALFTQHALQRGGE